jgi:hypothetical protein
MKYRPHRGSLQDAMAECVDLDGTLVTLAAHIGVEPNRITVKPYGYDDRIEWDTHIVDVDGYAEGFTDGPILI